MSFASKGGEIKMTTKVSDLIHKPRTRTVSVARGGRLKVQEKQLREATANQAVAFAMLSRKIDDIQEQVDDLHSRTFLGRIERFKAFVSRLILKVRRKSEQVVSS